VEGELVCKLNTLFNFIVSEEYLNEGYVGTFVEKVVQTIDNMYKRNTGHQNELVMWLFVCLWLIDASIKKYLSSEDDLIQVSGLVFKKDGQMLLDKVKEKEYPKHFINELHCAAINIYNFITINIYAKVRPKLVPALLKDLKQEEPKTIIKVLNEYCLRPFKEYNIYPVVTKQCMFQVFYFINCVLFNEFMDFGEKYCNRATALEAKWRTSVLEEWVSDNLDVNVSEALSPLRDVVSLLIVDKSSITSTESLSTICPTLSYNQLLTILTEQKPASEKERQILSDIHTFVEPLANQEWKESPKLKIRFNEMENII